MRSRMSRGSSSPKAPSIRRRGCADRRCTPPTAVFRCIRRCSARTASHCCPASTEAPTCGSSTSMRPVRSSSTRLERAIVRSRERLSYVEAQGRIDAGTVDGPLALLQEIGLLRIEQERARGGASLNSPEAEIVRSDGGYALEWRQPAARRGLERAALAHDRHGRRRADGRCPRRHPPHHARTRSRSRSPRSARRPRRSGDPGPRRSRTASTCAASIAATRRASRSCARPAASSAARATRRSTETCRATPCSRRSRRRTPTSPRRCADSSTGGDSSSARR